MDMSRILKMIAKDFSYKKVWKRFVYNKFVMQMRLKAMLGWQNFCLFFKITILLKTSCQETLKFFKDDSALTKHITLSI